MGVSRLGLISSMNLDVRKGIQSVKSTWSVLHSNLKACIPLPLEVNNKGSKMNKHTHTHTQGGNY